MAVESSVLFFNESGKFTASSYPGCVSFTVMNKGDEDCIIYNNFPINPGDSPITFEYPWPKQRKDNVNIVFGNTGGINKAIYIWLTFDDDYTD